MQGKWARTSSWNTILDPLNGEPFIKVAEVDETGIQVYPFMCSIALLLYFRLNFPVVKHKASAVHLS